MVVNKYVLIIFDTNNVITEDIIRNSHGLKHQFCDITTMDNLLKHKKILKRYKAVVDCTVGNVFYNSQKVLKNGFEKIENNFKYMKTSTDKIIGVGPNISRLTAVKFNNSMSIIENFKKDYNEYLNVIDFVLKKIPETRNKINFNTAIKTTGIDLTSEIKNKFEEKKYKLVKKLPITKEENTEYITYDNIIILNKLKEIIEYIK